MTRRALVVRGGWDGHVPVAATDAFLPYLQAEGFDTVVSETLDSYADRDLMSGIDLVVQCWTMGEIAAEPLTGLREAVASGTGFAGWHGGIVDSFRASNEYLQLTGGQFVAHPHNKVPYTVEIRRERAEHPIVAGLGTIAVETEQYWVLTDGLNDVLATTTLPVRAGEPWAEPVTSPAIWTRNWGSGRVFVCTVGHDLDDLAHPGVRTVIERGLLWAARGSDS